MKLTRRTLTTLILPLLAAAAVTLVFLSLSKKPAASVMKTVVVMTADFSAGHIISPKDLSVTKTTQVNPGDLVSPSEAVGLLLTVSLRQGEVLRQEDVKPLSEATLAQQLPLGERAVSIAVNAVSAVNFTIQRGDKVDILATISTTASQSGVYGAPLSDLILSDITVLGMTPPAANQSQGIVTLEVTPSQATLLELTDQLGTVDLALRPTKDTSTDTPVTKVGSLP